jgi:hypothetical protein
MKVKVKVKTDLAPKDRLSLRQAEALHQAWCEYTRKMKYESSGVDAEHDRPIMTVG